MLAAAFSYQQPVAIRYPKGGAAELPILPAPLELGHAVQLQDGRDMAFFAIGSMVEPALEAAQILAGYGIQARVVNARDIAPLDKEALTRAVRECQSRLITVEENVISGGFGAACAEALAGMPIQHIPAALPPCFQPHGNREKQLSELGLDGPGLATLAGKRWFSDKWEG